MVFRTNGKDVHAASSETRLHDCGVFELPAINVPGQCGHGNRNVIHQTELISFVLVVTDQSGPLAGNRHANTDTLQAFARLAENRQFVIDGGNDQAHVFDVANAFDNRNGVAIRCERNDMVPVTKVKSRRQWIDIGCNDPAFAEFTDRVPKCPYQRHTSRCRGYQHIDFLHPRSSHCTGVPASIALVACLPMTSLKCSGEIPMAGRKAYNIPASMVSPGAI